MEELFVPYELSLELKELGFDKGCFGRYRRKSFQSNTLCRLIDYNTTPIIESDISSPLWQQAFDWFRDEHDYWCWIEKYKHDETYIFQIPKANFERIKGYYNTYEEAQIECMKTLIKLLKRK